MVIVMKRFKASYYGFLVGDETLYPFTNTKVTNLDIVDIYKKYIERLVKIKVLLFVIENAPIIEITIGI